VPHDNRARDVLGQPVLGTYLSLEPSHFIFLGLVWPPHASNVLTAEPLLPRLRRTSFVFLLHPYFSSTCGWVILSQGSCLLTVVVVSPSGLDYPLTDSFKLYIIFCETFALYL